MRRWRLLVFAAIVALVIPFGLIAQDYIAKDSCLDRGGAWYGVLGCEMQLQPEIDRIVIDKSDRTLFAYSGRSLIREMPVSLGRAPVGQKQFEGDSRTPEGIYPVTEHKGDSTYYLAMLIGYPTTEQEAQSRDKGTDPGGDIMIHGIRNGLGWLGRVHRLVDWTQGCIALTDGEILWLYRHTADGVPVEIRA